MPRRLAQVVCVLASLSACEGGAGGVPDAGQAAASPAGSELSTRKAPRCRECGWIEAKRELVPAGVLDAHALPVYEYTVRMADGSTRVFEEALPVSWRLRERLMFIDGASGPKPALSLPVF